MRIKSKYIVLAVKQSRLVLRIVFSLILIFFISNKCSRLRCQENIEKEEVKSVLVLFDFQPEYPFIELAKKTIHSTLKEHASFELEFYYEFMDLQNLADTFVKNQLVGLYSSKYKQKKVDLLIIQSEEVLEFWVKHQSLIFSNVPQLIVYDIEPEYLYHYRGYANIIGLPIKLNYLKSVKWLLDYKPSINEIVVVNGSSYADSDNVNIEPLVELKKRLNKHVKFTDWSIFSLNEIIEKARSLPENSMILYLTMFQDASGKKYRPYDALKKLANVSSVPVIGNYSQYIGTGTIGGYVFSIENASEQASHIAIKILEGNIDTNFNINPDQGNRFIFDHEALIRYGIPLSALPDNSLIRNRQYNIWERYKIEIIAIIVVFVILIVLIIYLINLSRRLNKTSLALSELNKNLEAEVQYQTEELRATNDSLKLEVEERKRIEKDLVKLNLQLKESNATKDRFFSIIAHDLRNPFNTILGFSDVLINDLESMDTNKLGKLLRIIKSQAKSTLELLENLLSWAQSQTGKIKYQPEIISLPEIIKQVIDVVRSSAQIKEIDISLKSSDINQIYADANMLRTIFRNMLTNAIKFTQKGGEISITCQFNQEKTEVEINIADNGVGMDEETKSKLFRIDTNASKDGTEKEKGSGLGLILCKTFVDKHKGKIWVESEQGKGSEFKISLPLESQKLSE